MIDLMSRSNATQPGQPEKVKQPASKRTHSRFLAAYAECGSVTAAAKAAGIDRTLHHRHLKSDVEYCRAFEALQEQVGQELEDLAVERVRNGVKRQLFWRGKPVKQNRRLVYEVQFDTTLHLALLKRFRPTQYVEHQSVDVSGSIDLVERIKAAKERLLRMQPPS